MSGNSGTGCRMSKNTSLEDVILLVLGLAGGVIRGRTKLQKILFLLKQERGLADIINCDFKPYLFGPYSKDIQMVLDNLKRKQLIEEKEFQFIDPDVLEERKGYIIALTEKGCRRFFELLDKSISNNIVKRILAETPYIQYLATTPLLEILRYVYSKYPNYRGKALPRDVI